MELVVALAVGVVVGLSLGTLGAGGSVLTVPALVYLLGESPPAANSLPSGSGALPSATSDRVFRVMLTSATRSNSARESAGR